MSRALLHLHGLTLESVRRDGETEQWIFIFTSRITLQVSSAWRVVAGGLVIVGWRDDGPECGLPAALDARARVQTLVGSSPVETAEVGAEGDLVVRFASATALEVFNDSARCEGWQLFGPGDRYIVAQGGGSVVDSGT